MSVEPVTQGHSEAFRKESERIYKELSKDFPEEALSTDDSRGFDLTSVRAQYVIERLNLVLGIWGWTFVGEYEKPANGILFHGRLSIWVHDRWLSRQGVGYSRDKTNLGDTYKSARTDCLSKAASYFGVANEVFKGNVKPPEKGGKSSKTSATSVKNDATSVSKSQQASRYIGTADQNKFISEICEKYRVTDKAVKQAIRLKIKNRFMNEVEDIVREIVNG